ncbi:MAG: hypothetical protein J6O62_00275 [Bacilli bacterium]|nr:hypothetical protein [Bacilli bacterium]
MEEKLFSDVNLSQIEGMIDEIILNLELAKNSNLYDYLNSIEWQSNASKQLKTAISNNGENIDILLKNMKDFKRAVILAKQIDEIN